MAEPSSPAPEPARPITADRLLALEEKQRKIFTGVGRARRIATGCKEIDGYVLVAGRGGVEEGADRVENWEEDGNMEGNRGEDYGGIGGGGFERGVVVGLSAAEGDEGEGRGASHEADSLSQISLHAIASVLLSHLKLLRSSSKSQDVAKPKVIVVDTTGSFPLTLLAKVLRFRLSKLKSEMQAKNNLTGRHDDSTHLGTDDEENQQLSFMLDLVAISRVFDIEGLWEVLSEIARTTNQVNNDEANEGSMNSPPWHEEPEAYNKEVQPRIRNEIGDSEEEEEEEDLQSPSPPPPPPPPPKVVSKPQSTPIDSGPELLVIDNIHHLISHLFTHSEKTAAHNLLSLLSRTIHTLTHTQNLLTILHNSTISTKTNYPTPRRPPAPPTIQSIFTASTHLKPSLGRIFDQFVELHVMISRIPKFREDAEMAYAGGDGREANECLIFEVLRDECPVSAADRAAGRRFADREERWGCFEVGTDGVQLRDAFERGGPGVEGIGSGGGNDRGGEQGGGSAARLYGFGGRRV
ncbi:fasciclin domain family protein [Rutstroemia sp. NJR-2017a BBW]|nr:fasciclin domain family protein [Rutstroemia sp. NJR-2017a BBW]